MGFFDRLFKSRSAASGPVCLVCDSAELEWLATEAYRCRACGHEGGDGLPAHLQAEAVRKILALPPEARRALAEKGLPQARNMLEGIHLDSLRVDSVSAAADAILHVGSALAGIQVLADDARQDRDRAIMGAVRELAEAERVLADCGHALGRGDVLQHSVTSIPAKQLDRPEVLQRYRDGLLAIHASLAAELDSNGTAESAENSRTRGRTA